MSNPSLLWQCCPSPLGPLLIVTDAQGLLHGLDFAENEPRLRRLLRLSLPTRGAELDIIAPHVAAAIDAYFAGDVAALEAIPVALRGTEFQCAVWQALRQIKPGQTKTYGQLAAELGKPAASRAVGAASGANPISLVVPCHRVIGASGNLTGYAGTLPRKEWLLAHESKYAEQQQSARLLFV